MKELQEKIDKSRGAFPNLNKLKIHLSEAIDLSSKYPFSWHEYKQGIKIEDPEKDELIINDPELKRAFAAQE